MVDKIYYQNKPNYKANRRSLRSFQTKDEYVLWQELRKKKLGFRFRRQFQIGPFIVDFYCHNKKLIIELDGPIHEKQNEYDERRSVYLKNKGYSVIRFTNDTVLFEREKVLTSITNMLRSL